jgi:hypothetical protein
MYWIRARPNPILVHRLKSRLGQQSYLQIQYTFDFAFDVAEFVAPDVSSKATKHPPSILLGETRKPNGLQLASPLSPSSPTERSEPYPRGPPGRAAGSARRGVHPGPRRGRSLLRRTAATVPRCLHARSPCFRSGRFDGK